MNRRPCWFGLLLIAPILAGAAPPEVVRVRVPSGRVSAWFPPGTELRGLLRQEFEELARSSRAGWERLDAHVGPRMIGARHEARWVDGVLSGRSEFVIESEGSRPGEVVLDPWSPAVDPARVVGSPLRARDDGRIVLPIEGEGQSVVSVPWELRARPDSDGRVFALELPRLDATSLTLDLPADLIPEGPEGTRQGPGPISDPNRRGWRFDGHGGPLDLRLRASGERGLANRGPRLWAGGRTSIDIDETTARWQADWDVDPGADGPRQLSIELDPGLEPIEVAGPGVVAFRSEPGEAGTHLLVRLADELTGPTPITIRAVTQVPAEGRWSVPAARPLNASWTGGRTLIRPGPTRVVESSLERAGRRVVPRTDEESEPPPLTFEAGEPRSVAELVFRKPRVELTAKVQGRLRLGDQAPRLEARLSWTVHRGRLLEVGTDLPPGWIPTRVQWAGSEEPANWRSEPGPGGVTILRARPSTPGEPGVMATLVVAATAEGSASSGLLELPRLRPIPGPVAEEHWIAEIDPAWTIRPTQARGLAWVDPPVASEIEDPTRPQPMGPAVPGTGHLAWRWIDPAGEGRVECLRVASKPDARVRTLVSVETDRIHYEWRVEVEPSESAPRTLRIGSAEPIEGVPEWRTDLNPSGLPLTTQAIDPAQNAALGLPEGGSAWEVDLPPTTAGRLILHGRLDQPWDGRDSVALLNPLGEGRTEGLILVLVERSSRSSAEVSDLRRLDPTVTGDLLIPTMGREVGESLASHRRAHAFKYAGPSGRLTLQTETLLPGPIEGLVQEAILSTNAAAAGVRRHRLTLRVAPTRARALDVELPAGSTLARVRCDGQPIAPIRHGDALSLVLPALASSRALCSFTLDYATDVVSEGEEFHLTLRPARPKLSLPCLAFSWEVVLADPWTLDEIGPALIGSDPTSERTASLADPLAWTRGAGAFDESEAEAEALRDLDSRVASSRSEELTLADWFARWDAGRWPLVIDRMALAEARWGPRSRIVPPRPVPGETEGAAANALRTLGLTVIPVRGILLITTPDRAPDRSDRRTLDEAWGPRLLDAAGLGSDVADRFQSVTRWRGEATPEVAPTLMATDGSEGSIRRLAAAGWPGRDAWVDLAEPSSSTAWGFVIGLAAVLMGILGRDLPARPRGLVAGAALAASMLASAWAWPRPSSMAAGLSGGTLAALAFWAGRALRRRGFPGRSRGGRTTVTTPARRSAAGPARVMVILAAALVVAGWALADDPEPLGRILALLPFDGPPDPNTSGDRVVLRLDDYERLRAWADLSSRPSSGRVLAEVADHRVRWRGAAEVQVESTVIMVSDGPGRSTWSFPIGEAQDLTASLDDHPAPITIGPEAKVGTIEVEGEGRHRLRIERLISPRAGDPEAYFRLPVGPMANARLVVDPPPQGRRVEVPSAGDGSGPARGGASKP